MLNEEPIVANIDDLNQITALVGGERFGSLVDDDEEIDTLDGCDQARQTAFVRPGRDSPNGRDVRL